MPIPPECIYELLNASIYLKNTQHLLCLQSGHCSSTFCTSLHPRLGHVVNVLEPVLEPTTG